MKNIKIFAFLAVFLLSAFVSTAWAEDVTLTYKISVRGAIPHAYITNADGKTVCDWGNGIGTLWPANEGHTMNDDYKITFKPNQELDKTGKNENKESTSTTAFKTENNTTFTVSVGKEGFYFKSVTFKEDDVEKASFSNIAPNSTSIRVEVPENKFFNYITVVLTTNIHYSLSYDGNLTVSPSPSMTYNNIPYYAAGQTVTFGFSGSGSVVYFVNGERIEGNSVTVGQEDLTVQIGVPYIDENGKEQIRELGEYTVLTSLTDVSNLGGGWYVVQGKVKYTSQVTFNGEAHLILADGAEMKIETESKYGVYASNNLTIYGQSKQSEQSGILNAKTTGYDGIYGKGYVTISGGTVTATGNNDGIYSYKGVTISGGKVTATGDYANGIFGGNGVTISGGTVEATGDYANGIYGGYGVTISGGKVTATGNDGIRSYGGNIILGWTNSTDFIKASRYYSENGSVSIAEGKSFKDEIGYVYRGTLTGEQLSAIKGKKLEPCAVALDLQDGKAPVMLPATFDENGVAHVEKPADPTRDGFTFVGWFTTKDGNTEFDFSAAITGNTTAYAKWKENALVEYIDEKGVPKSVTVYTELTSLTDVSNLGGGWYVVLGKVKYSNQVRFSGDAHLILADGAEMEIKTEGQSEHGIYASNNLTIYGQNGQSGILNDTANGTNCFGIYSKGTVTISGGTVTATGSYRGIYGYYGITISGGTVKASGSSAYGIYGYNEVTISGGTVTATSTYGVGIYCENGVTISGGSVTASGSGSGIYGYNGVTISGGTVKATSDYSEGIYSNSGDITLGWTNSTDFINANRYYSYKGSVQIAEGKSFKDEKGYVYRGTLNAEQLSTLEGQKLEPFKGVSVSFVDNFSGASEVIAEIAVDGEGHVSAPSKHPFHSGYAFVGWFTTKDGNTEFDFTKAVTGNTTAYAHWNENTPVEYIDEKGAPKSVSVYTVLTSLTDVSNLGGGWYVVLGKVKYSNQVRFSGDAHLILADGAEMEIETEGKLECGICASNNLTIYGQNEQSGILNATDNNYGIVSFNNVTISGGTVEATGNDGYGIYSSEGNITISGGSVKATGKNNGIYSSEGNIKISGGNVKATATNGSGIYSSEGNITISGGSVKASGNFGSGIYSFNGVTISGGTVETTGEIGDGIYVYKGNITLGWTNSTDYIKASSYYSNKGSVQITEGKSFKDEDGNVYSGMLTGEQITAISHQTIEPLPWKNLGDYAAVQIFEDGNGKKHAVIDGGYEGTETVDIPNEIAVDAVDYIRDFDANTPSTVLMPVRLPSCATVNAKFYKLDEVYQSGYRWVAKVQNIGKALPQANTAYAVMLPTAGKLEFNFEGCATAEEKQAIVQTDEIQTSGNTDGSWYFTGTYAFKRWTETENKDEVGLVYGFAGSNEDGIAKGQFGRVDFGAHANPLRCYLRKKDKSVVLKAQTLAKAAPQVLKAAPYSISLLPETIDVEFVDEDENGEHTTVIGRMDTRTGKIRLLRTDRTYDLKGRRVNDVNRAAKGAYYGKKF